MRLGLQHRGAFEITAFKHSNDEKYIVCADATTGEITFCMSNENFRRAATLLSLYGYAWLDWDEEKSHADDLYDWYYVSLSNAYSPISQQANRTIYTDTIIRKDS